MNTVHNGWITDSQREVISCAPFLFKWRHGNGEWQEVQTHLYRRSYNIDNMMAAAWTVSDYFDMTPEQINDAYVITYPATTVHSWRSLHTINLSLTLTTKPTSMMAALKNFRDIGDSKDGHSGWHAWTGQRKCWWASENNRFSPKRPAWQMYGSLVRSLAKQIATFASLPM